MGHPGYYRNAKGMYVKMSPKNITQQERDTVIAEFHKGGDNTVKAIAQRLQVKHNRVAAILDKYFTDKQKAVALKAGSLKN